ncbi:MAG: DUF4139 domain-containing protein [Chitinophagales bacterium]|nr:DUF4139 domain-containing protein [Chitinophagales bacterium]
MKLSTTLVFLLLIVAATAEETITAPIKAITVYRQQAAITHSTTVNIDAGTSDLVLTDISPGMIGSTVQVKVEGNAVILAVNSRINSLKENKGSEKIQVLNDSLETLNDAIDGLNTEKQVYEAEKGLLNSNQKLGGTANGFTTTELQNLADLYRKRMLELNGKIAELNKTLSKLYEKQVAINTQLQLLNGTRYKPTGEIFVSLSSKVATKVTLSCTYLIANAGWSPIYDIRSDGLDKPLSLSYKAQVYQNSGYDWSKVQLTLSTGDPSQGHDRPILNPLYVNFYNNYYSLDEVSVSSSKYEYKRLDKSLATMPGAEINTYGWTSAMDTVATYNVDIIENQLTAEYAIELPQTIPADGQKYGVNMATYELPAIYEYHSVPKLDKGAYLLARATKWGEYNLLPGPANIYFEGKYIGEIALNPFTSADTLLVSLGRDDKINLQRITLQDSTSNKLIGGERKETKIFEITVRNNKKQAVDISILDQIPVSQQEDIKIKLLEKGNAEYSEEIGKLLWKVKLAPNETRKIRFSYELKYPKDKTLTAH